MKNCICTNGTIITLGCLLALKGFGQTNTWNVDGNLVSPGQFLGSTNFAAVDLKAGGMRVLRLEPDSRTNVGGLSGNLIGGFINNLIEQPSSGGDFIGPASAHWMPKVPPLSSRRSCTGK